MPEVHKCRTCNTRLNVFELNGKRTYTHAGQHTSSDLEKLGHVPDPVPEVEYDGPVNVVCDFCGLPDPVWDNDCRPARDAFVMLTTATGDYEAVEYRDNNPNWLACDGCQDLIINSERLKLVTRSLDRLVLNGRIQARHRELVARDVKQMHDLFFQNRTGSFRKLPN